MSQIASDNQIQTEIDDIKTRFSNTQELYREVAALLFFRYGITPTANKLYQYVRKGSMTAPAEALNKFWADLREKSRVRIQAPDLPEELADQAGSLVAALWDMAQSQAQESFAHLRNDIEAQLIALRMERDSALDVQAASKNSLEVLAQSTARLESQLGALTADKLALEAKLVATNVDRERLQQEIKESRESFSSDLERVRASLNAIDARSEAEIKRCLIEIDRERILANKASKELNVAKSNLSKQQAAGKAEMGKLQKQVSTLRESSGKLLGQLAQLKIQLAETRKELASANAKLLNPSPKTASSRPKTRNQIPSRK